MKTRVANALCILLSISFGGRTNTKFRISRSFMHTLVGEPLLHPEHIKEVDTELRKLGATIIDMDSYFVVLPTNFESVRRVTFDSMKVIGVSVKEDTN